MSKINDIIHGAKTFFEEVIAELKKCSWPTRSELFDSTVVVIVSVLILGAFVAVCDLALRQAVHMVLN